jgi:hypothetical protein
MKTPASVDLAQRLSTTSGSKDRFGSTADAVLATAALIAAADQDWDQRAVSTFQRDQDIHPKVWGKLVAIARSKNLEKVPKKEVPVSYTALYALVVMKEEELATALEEGFLQRTPGQGPISSRAILEWTKAYRLRGTGVEQEVPLTLVLREELTEEHQQDLLSALQEVAGRFGAEVLQGKGGLKQAEVKAEARRARAQEIEEELLRLIGTDVLNAPEDLKTRFGISTAADLLEGPRGTFTGFFQNLVGKVEGAFWQRHGRTYCLRIARDFNLTDSRAERYQLRQRIKDAMKKNSAAIHGFDEMASGILVEYML